MTTPISRPRYVRYRSFMRLRYSKRMKAWLEAQGDRLGLSAQQVWDDLLIAQGLTFEQIKGMGLAILGSVPYLKVGDTVNFSLSIAGGTPPYTVSSSGTLPPNVSFNSNTLAFTSDGPLDEEGLWNFTVSVEDDDGNVTQRTLAFQVHDEVDPPIEDAPSIVVYPEITGDLQVTEIIAVSNGQWDNASSVDRQWQRSPSGSGDWSDIEDATSAAYLLEEADLDQHIRVRETAIGPGGSTSEYSNVVGPVEAAPEAGYKLLEITARGNVGVLETPFVTPTLALPEPIAVTISREGYDPTGAPTRNVFHTQSRFKRYNRVTATTNVQPPMDGEVSLDDNACVGDIVSQAGLGNLTNNSELVIPTPRMAHVDNDHKVVGNSLTVGACGAALGARQQRFFAVVKYQLSVENVPTGAPLSVTTVTPHIYQTGLSVQSYNGVFDLSSVPDGSSVQVDTTGYPWYGTAVAQSKKMSNASADVGDYIYSGGFRRQYFFKHAALAAARPTAYVDTVNGDNGTGVVGYYNDPSSLADASASPFATVQAALTAIAAANNVNHGFAGIDGAVIRLKTDITSATYTNGQSFHRGSSILIEKDPESYPEGNARINLSANMGLGTVTVLNPGDPDAVDMGTLSIYLSGISIARMGIFYINGGQWILTNGSMFINDGDAPSNASRIAQSSGVYYFGDGSVQYNMPGQNIHCAPNNAMGGCHGARGLTTYDAVARIPDHLFLGCRFTANLDPQNPWPQTNPNIHGSNLATMFAEGTFFGRIGNLSTALTRYAGGPLHQALVSVNCIYERSYNATQNCFGISSDGQSNSTEVGVLFYGVTQVGYNLAGRGNSFYSDKPVDKRLHPFPIYCQSIIARNAWKGVQFTDDGDNPEHLDGAEWYGMGVGRKYNGYIWLNQFQRPISESQEFGSVTRARPESDRGGGYDFDEDFMDWEASKDAVSPTANPSYTGDGNGDYRVKISSSFHGIVMENFLMYDIEGNPRPATGDSPGAYVRMTA